MAFHELEPAGAVEVIVAANACTDATVPLARADTGLQPALGRIAPPAAAASATCLAAWATPDLRASL